MIVIDIGYIEIKIIEDQQNWKTIALQMVGVEGIATPLILL